MGRLPGAAGRHRGVDRPYRGDNAARWGAVDDPRAAELAAAWAAAGPDGIVEALFGREGLLASDRLPGEADKAAIRQQL
jgi:fructuronate reductase